MDEGLRPVEPVAVAVQPVPEPVRDGVDGRRRDGAEQRSRPSGQGSVEREDGGHDAAEPAEDGQEVPPAARERRRVGRRDVVAEVAEARRVGVGGLGLAAPPPAPVGVVEGVVVPREARGPPPAHLRDDSAVRTGPTRGARRRKRRPARPEDKRCSGGPRARDPGRWQDPGSRGLPVLERHPVRARRRTRVFGCGGGRRPRGRERLHRLRCVELPQAAGVVGPLRDLSFVLLRASL